MSIQSEPHHQDRVGLTTSSRSRRRLVTVTAVTAACLVPIVLVMAFFQFPAVAFQRTLSDANQMVAVDIPAGWQDTTADPRAIKYDDSGYYYLEPDISARVIGLDSASYLHVLIELAPFEEPADDIHRQAVAAELESFGQAVPEATTSTPGGFTTVLSKSATPGVEFLSDYTLVVRTMMTEEYFVTVVGTTDAVASSSRGQQVSEIVQSAHIP